SAGGVEALGVLLGTLPAELPAAVLVAPHLPPRDGGGLAGVLDRAGPLKAVPAEDAATVEHGPVYVARPGHHLLVPDRRIRPSPGPRHHRHRPAAHPPLIRAALDAGGPAARP